MKPKSLCIYHGGCTDGMAAAWAVWKKIPDCRFYPGIYQQEPPYDLIDSDTDVIIVDFSYKTLAMREIAKRSKSLTVLDHHKSAMNDLKHLLLSGEIQGEFDMERCGALMAWDYFHPKKPRPDIFKLIDNNDRWLPERDAATILALRSYPHRPDDDTELEWVVLMTTWNYLMSIQGFRQLLEEGVSIYRYYRARVDETKPHASLMTIGPYDDIPVVNAPYYLASDVAGELAQVSKSGIAAVWWKNKDGSITFSLRSRGEVDVSDLAVSFGGGGHPGAAGFKMSADEFRDFELRSC